MTAADHLSLALIVLGAIVLAVAVTLLTERGGR